MVKVSPFLHLATFCLSLVAAAMKREQPLELLRAYPYTRITLWPWARAARVQRAGQLDCLNLSKQAANRRERRGKFEE